MEKKIFWSSFSIQQKSFLKQFYIKKILVFKKTYCIISIFFTSNLFASDTCMNYFCEAINIDNFLIVGKTALSYHTGYLIHHELTVDFNDNNNIDQCCAVSSGAIWSAYGLNCISPQAYCCLTSTLLLMHNGQKATEKLFIPNSLNAPYNNKKYKEHMK